MQFLVARNSLKQYSTKNRYPRRWRTLYEFFCLCYNFPFSKLKANSHLADPVAVGNEVRRRKKKRKCEEGR